jgi:hypothetical protein
MKNSCCKFRFLIPVFIVGFLALFSFVVYELWNGVLADVLGVKTITYWQALGILVLSKILFGGFPFKRGGPGFGPPWMRHHKMMEHWQSLTPEEREKIRQRCGDWPSPPEKQS